VRITDDADCEDLTIHGRIILEKQDVGEKIEAVENKAIAELKKYYSDLLREFPELKISLNETNFKERWIDYSLESKDDIIAVNVWKTEQGVGLIPTPESKVGADIY